MIDLKCNYLSDEFKNLFMQFLVSQDHETTVKEFIQCVKYICDFAEKDFLELTRKDIDGYFLQCQNSKLSHSTIRVRYYRLLRLSRFIAQRIPGSRIAADLMLIRMPQLSIYDESRNIQKRFISYEQFSKLLEAANANCDHMAALIFSLSYDAALSASEVCELTLNRIFVDSNNRVNIHIYDDSYHSERTVILNKNLGNFLSAYIEMPKRKPSIYLFLNQYGNPMTLRNLSMLFRKYCATCGLGTDITFRDLRTSGILNLLSERTSKEVGQNTNLKKMRLAQYNLAKRGIHTMLEVQE